MKINEFITESSIFGKQKNKIYNLMVSTIDSGPFDGGCVTVAMALQMVFGGDIVVLVGVPHDNVKVEAAQHAALLLDNILIDGDGPLPIKPFINRFVRSELAHVGGVITGIRPIADDDLPEAPRDKQLAAQIAQLIPSKLK